MEKVLINLNGHDVIAPANITILQAAKLNGICIPTLCDFPDQRAKSHCRVCLVEVEGSRNLLPACSTMVSNGMKITTNSARVRETVKTVVELILADHPQDCLTCIRNGNCELRRLAEKLGIPRVDGEKSRSGKNLFPIDTSTPSLVRNPNKCIKCGRCAEVCHHPQAGVLFSNYRSVDVCVTPAFGVSLAESSCVLCGQCALVCPVGAIYEKDDTAKLWDAIGDKSKHVVVQVAPSVRVSIAEEFGYSPGTISTKKMVSALRALGVDKVFDTNFSADLTIMEEGHELLERMQTGGVLPMITSCSPGWINYIEQYYPELLPHVSTCKSPQQMFGAVAKTYYAQQAGINPADIVVVSVMPCVAKKFEAARPEMNSSGYQDVDVVLTTRELGRMLRSSGISFDYLPEGEFDSPLGLSTGAAVIFGTSGGVMEAALRTVYEVATGKTLENLDFKEVRGMEGIKKATVDLAGTEVKVAVTNGLANAKEILEEIKSGKSDSLFIEVMCCPGGCIGGGGQPWGTTNEVRQKRMESSYIVDRNLPIRKSHDNPDIKKLYEDFLEKPLGERSHHLLHTHYTARSKAGI